jgi:hypothetical protein
MGGGCNWEGGEKDGWEIPTKVNNNNLELTLMQEKFHSIAHK